MPTRNQSQFVEAAIRSALVQGNDELRLIVQDGASSDGTPDLLARLAGGAPAIEFRSEADAGPADALNRAFARALANPKTQLFGWLNSDDLFAAGALGRVQAHFSSHPDHVAVYGQARHVDINGGDLGLYPTGSPAQPLTDWAEGCPICQPTLWLRREALEAILPLDTTLKAAFDFDLWFKLFKLFPRRIDFIDEVLAYSRLHALGITLSQRRTVALEGLRVLHRHLGGAPGHWLLTYADELRRQLPDGEGMPLRQRLSLTLVEAAQWLSPNEAQAVAMRWRSDRAVALASRDCVVDVHPDGWMPAQATLRLRARQACRLVLRGRHEGGQAVPLALQAIGPEGQRQTLSVPGRGSFSWTLQVGAQPDTTQHWQLLCTPGFVPARTAAGSTDTRELGWLLDSVTTTG